MSFIWDTKELLWEQGYDALAEYKKTHGDVAVPKEYTSPDGFKLGAWQGTQRQRKNKMSVERIQRLDDLGFIWDSVKLLWEKGYDALAEYKKSQNNVMVPSSYQTPDGFKLGRWVFNQRRQESIGEMPVERTQRLNDLGFVWKVT